MQHEWKMFYLPLIFHSHNTLSTNGLSTKKWKVEDKMQNCNFVLAKPLKFYNKEATVWVFA